MYWFASTGTTQQIINTVKLPVLSKKQNKFNLGLNTKRLFQVLAKLPLTTTETELVFITIDGVSELPHQSP